MSHLPVKLGMFTMPLHHPARERRLSDVETGCISRRESLL